MIFLNKKRQGWKIICFPFLFMPLRKKGMIRNMKNNYYIGADEQKYATTEKITETNKRYYENMKINDSSKIKYPDVQPNLNFVLKTEPVKDADGKIIEPSKYLDAQTPNTFETELMQVWNNLTPTQKKAFIQVMAIETEKNKELSETSKRGK